MPDAANVLETPMTLVDTPPALPDQAAWKDLRSTLERFLARRVPQRDVEDLLHDTILRISRGLPHLRETDRLSAWVFQIARNAIADHYRRPAARRDQPAGEDADLIAAEPAEETGSATDLVDHLRDFIQLLPALHRQALELTDLQGLTQTEAAHRLGLSVPGMKSRVQRARAQLRDMLDACCHIELDARNRILDLEPRELPPELGRCCCRPAP